MGQRFDLTAGRGRDSELVRKEITKNKRGKRAEGGKFPKVQNQRSSILGRLKMTGVTLASSAFHRQWNGVSHSKDFRWNNRNLEKSLDHGVLLQLVNLEIRDQLQRKTISESMETFATYAAAEYEAATPSKVGALFQDKIGGICCCPEKLNVPCFGFDAHQLESSTGPFTSPKYLSSNFGGPGSGKGSQCSKIAAPLGFCHLSAGKLLSREVESGSENGTMIKAFKMEGKLVPADMIIKLLQQAMEESGTKKFLLDGFPRNNENRSAFEKIGKDRTRKIKRTKKP
ncbi:hypothetical protein RJ639_033806 [Escallonia herrerae]|uniref:adenylate kinase n=1 Tax=Escallonia herrerae TaxID=1293975 RepID=A0AA89BAH7_9ASTE|nr:hypothetical protein RJ639_033806 [Escallonia herrerae]